MFDILTFFNRLFGTQREDTRSAARDRLRLVLVSDRATVAPQLMESLRNELIEVISRYMDIDTRSMQMGLERHEGVMALAANIPVRSVHRSSAEMPAVPMAPPPRKAEAGPPVRPARPFELLETSVELEPSGEFEASAELEPSLELPTPGRLESSRVSARRRNRRHKRKV